MVRYLQSYNDRKILRQAEGVGIKYNYRPVISEPACAF